jgi:hypothetical protein
VSESKKIAKIYPDRIADIFPAIFVFGRRKLTVRAANRLNYHRQIYFKAKKFPIFAKKKKYAQVLQYVGTEYFRKTLHASTPCALGTGLKERSR